MNKLTYVLYYLLELLLFKYQVNNYADYYGIFICGLLMIGKRANSIL